MSLNYEYATVDVDILVHPKALAAGVEAMGLWLWAMAWSHKTGANGRIPRHVIALAWGGTPALLARLAKRLVASGLWLESPDGWEVWNYGKKNQSAEEKERRKALGRARMRRLREKKAEASRDTSPSSHPASRDAHVPCQDGAPDLICDPDLGSPGRDPEPDGSPIRAEPAPSRPPPPSDAQPTSPDWWPAAVATAEQAVGGTIDQPGARWLEYDAARDRKGWARSHRDAVGWLTTVIRSERKTDPGRRRVPRAIAEATLQPFDPAAPWMKAGDIGETGT